MSYSQTTDTQTHAVNLRVRHDIRDLIDRAAKIQGKTRSDFINTYPALLKPVFFRISVL